MPRHLISDAHEWINEIPTVPIYCQDVLRDVLHECARICWMIRPEHASKNKVGRKHNDLGGKDSALGDSSCWLDETPQWAREIDLWCLSDQSIEAVEGPK